MSDPVGMAVDLGTQALRLGWFYGVNRLVERRTARSGAVPTVTRTRPVPGQRALLADLADLAMRDARAVRAGWLPPAELGPDTPHGHLLRLRDMFRDLPGAIDRRSRKDAETARERAAELPPDRELPPYFTQDFHFQTGGYLTGDSARLYDVQVETLFYGSAQLMRRAAVRAVLETVRGRDQRTMALADIACGTGRLLREIRRVLPAIGLTGIDLSDAYLDAAREHMGRLRPATIMWGNAEALPLEAVSQDVVTCAFLFHELPPEVRRTVAREIARVLKPGGTLVFLDSLQMGDRPEWDGLLEAFPQRFHEPYYRHYAIDDLDGLFSEAGLEPVLSDRAFLSKILVRLKA